MRRAVLAATLALCASLAAQRLGAVVGVPGRRAATASARSATARSTRSCSRPRTTPCPPRRSDGPSRTSRWAVPQQLAYGVRGLLWDVHYGHKSPSGSVVTDAQELPESKLYLCHEACQLGATPLVEVLQAIRIFLHFHPRNVIVIVNEDYISPTDYAQAFRPPGSASTCTAAARAPGRRCGR